MTRFKAAVLCICTLFLLPSIAAAQSFPARAVTLVVPYAAGTGADGVARALATQLGTRLGQPVVIENRAGAGTNIGHAHVAKARPDGHTLLFASVSGLAANKSLYSSLGYDPQKDLTPVAFVGKGTMVVLATPESGVRTIEQLKAYAQKNPGKVNFGAANTFARVWIEVLETALGVQAETVLYANAPAMLNDLMGGHINFTVENTGTSRPLVSTGKLIPLALTSKARGKFNSTVPTLSELGITDLEMDPWYAIYAPAGVQESVITRLNAEINAIQANADYLRVADFAEYIGGGGTPKELGAFQAQEIDKWRELVNKTGIRLE